MTNTNAASTTTNADTQIKPASGKAPTHAAYHIREIGKGENKKSLWTRVGSAWMHADKLGFNIQIECVPLDGRITVRAASERKE